ncbi:MAG: metalloregulator ArsR/SmtB family transcription factor [Gammaproteobacteria bacterium]|nr:metalloregulator ArsR/SmtB family transcription factor [Gammaproteobacteria bacterium]MCP5299646.1 metalloregulator ArsR/SmtB family transcription factor [Chromatiaceae bacterium]
MNISPANLFALLSHDTRLRSVMLLMAVDELCVCEFTAVFGAAQPHVSRHLGQLREAGLLRDRRGGQWIYYRLNPELPSWARDILDAVESGMRDQRPFVDDRAFIADSMDRRACGE